MPPAAHTWTLTSQPRSRRSRAFLLTHLLALSSCCFFGASCGPKCCRRRPFESDTGAAQPQARPLFRREPHRLLRPFLRKGESPRRVEIGCWPVGMFMSRNCPAENKTMGPRRQRILLLPFGSTFTSKWIALRSLAKPSRVCLCSRSSGFLTRTAPPSAPHHRSRLPPPVPYS